MRQCHAAPVSCSQCTTHLHPTIRPLIVTVLHQVSTLEEDIAQVRTDLISKDDQLRELMQQASSGDETVAAEVNKLKADKNALQAQLECKSRQLKVSHLILKSQAGNVFH